MLKMMVNLVENGPEISWMKHHCRMSNLKYVNSLSNISKSCHTGLDFLPLNFQPKIFRIIDMEFQKIGCTYIRHIYCLVMLCFYNYNDVPKTLLMLSKTLQYLPNNFPAITQN